MNKEHMRIHNPKTERNLEVCRLYKEGNTTYKKLAEKFKTSSANIARIITNNRFKERAKEENDG